MSSLKCQVRITLSDITAQKAQAVKKALEPDNVDFPKNLSLEVKNIQDRLVFDFESKGDIKKLVGTVDEVIEHVQVALKVIE